MKDKIVHLFAFLSFFVFYLPANAGIIITEIMYDREGTDTKREWIEVYNDGDSNVDLTQYKLREGETNHAIKLYKDTSILPALSYAIIADSPADIESDFPSGTIIADSVFSLSNNGELLEIVNSVGDILDSVFYDVSLGANGDGNSLQLIDGGWVSSSPTAGESNELNVTENTEDNNTVAETNSISIAPEDKTVNKDPINIDVSLPNYPVVGENSIFEAGAFDEYGNALHHIKYKWTFGDGSSGEGEIISHSYENEGDYVVFVEAFMADYYDNQKIRLHVYGSPFSIRLISNNSIEIKNESSKELDIGSWSIISNGSLYTLPKNTFILPKGFIKIGSKIAGFGFDNNTNLVSPSGNIISIEKISTKTAVITNKVVSNPETTRVLAQPEEEDSPKQSNLASVSKVNSGSFTWIVVMGVVLLSGLIVLYFLQKKHSLIDDIDIIEE